MTLTPGSQPVSRVHRTPGVAAALAAALAALLAACSVPVQPPPAVVPPHAPAVDLVELDHAIGFERSSARLARGEGARLLSFLAGLPGRPAGPIRLLVEAAGANDQLAAQRAAAVADLVQPLGLDIEISPVTPQGGATRDRALVRLRVAVVSLPGCGPAAPAAGYHLDNLPFDGFGCATARNLAAMVAEPADLVMPRALAPADGVREVGAITRYRDGKVTPLLDLETPR